MKYHSIYTIEDDVIRRLLAIQTATFLLLFFAVLIVSYIVADPKRTKTHFIFSHDVWNDAVLSMWFGVKHQSFMSIRNKYYK